MSAPPALPMPPDGNRDRGPQLLAIYWTQGGIAIIIVALRFYVRYAKRIIGIEDWAMLIALILYITGSALLPVVIHYGVGRHMYYVPPAQLSQVLRWNWVIQPFGIMSQPFGKISVSIFLLKLMGPNSFYRRWFLYVNMFIFTLMACLCVIFTYAQCNPPRALWEKVPDAKCWAPHVQANFSIATTAFGALFDYELSLLPLTILWNLKVGMKQKIGLYVLLGASIFSGISATIKAVQLQSLATRTDVTWATYDLYAWASTELFVNIVCGSLPTLKPLYDRWAQGRAIVPTGKDSKQSAGSSFRLKDSHKQISGGYSSKSHLSTTVTESGHHDGRSGDAITVVHSFDVQSKKDQPASTKEMV